MANKWYELVTGSLDEKKQYRELKRRLDAIPGPYGTVAKAMHRYFMYYAGVVDGATSLTMMNDLVELWERAATDGTPVRDIVGDDPVDFTETFAQAYMGKHWIDKERGRLTRAVEEAERGVQS
jgi:DNA-binding ferritin-like protein (Dps family)